MTRSETHEMAVIVRYTDYESVRVEDKIALRDAYEDVQLADLECARLNAAARDGSEIAVTYFVKIVRCHLDV